MGLLVVTGALLCLLLARWVRGGRYLAGVLLASYALRTALAAALYVISADQLPLLPSLQLGDGFWRFAFDPPMYHENGVRIAEAFRSGTNLPPIMFDANTPFQVRYYDYFYVVGLVYWAFGAHPLQIPLTNALLWTGIAVVSYLLARRMRGEAAGRVTATVVSLWPSSFIWSSQILKDSLVLFLLLLALTLVVWTTDASRKRAVVALLASLPVVFLLTRLREELGTSIAAAAIAWAGLYLVSKRRPSIFLGLAAVGLFGVALVTPSVDPATVLYRPSQPAASGSAEFAPSQTRDGGPTAPVLVDSPGTTNAPGQHADSVSTPFWSGLLERTPSTNPLGMISSRRRGYSTSEGASAFATDVQLETLSEVVLFLPLGLAYALYAPFPWDWLSPGGDTGVLKSVAGIETVLMVALTPLLLFALVRLVRSRGTDGWLLVIFGVIALCGLALTVTNVGILYRLRLQALIPLLVVTVAYGIPGNALERMAGLRRLGVNSKPGILAGTTALGAAGHRLPPDAHQD